MKGGFSVPARGDVAVEQARTVPLRNRRHGVANTTDRLGDTRAPSIAAA